MNISFLALGGGERNSQMTIWIIVIIFSSIMQRSGRSFSNSASSLFRTNRRWNIHQIPLSRGSLSLVGSDEDSFGLQDVNVSDDMHARSFCVWSASLRIICVRWSLSTAVMQCCYQFMERHTVLWSPQKGMIVSVPFTMFWITASWGELANSPL